VFGILDIVLAAGCLRTIAVMILGQIISARTTSGGGERLTGADQEAAKAGASTSTQEISPADGQRARRLLMKTLPH
jgi:hypothetical protein